MGNSSFDLSVNIDNEDFVGLLELDSLIREETRSQNLNKSQVSTNTQDSSAKKTQTHLIHKNKKKGGSGSSAAKVPETGGYYKFLTDSNPVSISDYWRWSAQLKNITGNSYLYEPKYENNGIYGSYGYYFYGLRLTSGGSGLTIDAKQATYFPDRDQYNTPLIDLNQTGYFLSSPEDIPIIETSVRKPFTSIIYETVITNGNGITLPGDSGLSSSISTTAGVGVNLPFVSFIASISPYRNNSNAPWYATSAAGWQVTNGDGQIYSGFKLISGGETVRAKAVITAGRVLIYFNDSVQATYSFNTNNIFSIWKGGYPIITANVGVSSDRGDFRNDFPSTPDPGSFGDINITFI